VALVVGAVEQEIERRLEHLGHLEIVQLQVQRRSHQPDHRCDHETGAGAVLRQATENLDLRRNQPDFLLGFAQRGGLGRGIAFFAAAAGKADLTGVVAQMRGALGQQHGGA
jgi:hypothetical protein